MKKVYAAIAVLAFVLAGCTSTGRCEDKGAYERELQEELSIRPMVEGREINEDRVAALRTLIAEAEEDCASNS